jgi:hypothetical protein
LGARDYRSPLAHGSAKKYSTRHPAMVEIIGDYLQSHILIAVAARLAAAVGNRAAMGEYGHMCNTSAMLSRETLGT